MRALPRIVACLFLSVASACANSGMNPTSNECVPGENSVSWEEALRLLQAGEVIGGGQAHSGHVFMDLRDGRHVITVQPRIDQIYDEIERLAPNKDELKFWTE
jgi:hypothetical protein